MTATSHAGSRQPCRWSLAMIDEARERKYYATGVIGLRGAPGPGQSRRTSSTTASSCGSARQSQRWRCARRLTEHRDGDWMVILTDRSDEDLGAGVLSHLVWHRLRRPDPWEAVRHRFSATGIDPSLDDRTRQPRPRDGPARGHAPEWLAGGAGRGADPVARSRLRGPSVARASPSDAADVLAVLRWSMRPTAVTALGDLRAQFGDVLADATLDWVADNAGAAASARAGAARPRRPGRHRPGRVWSSDCSPTVRGSTRRGAARGAARPGALGGPVGRSSAPRRQPSAPLGAAATALVADLADDERQARARQPCAPERRTRALEQLQTAPARRPLRSAAPRVRRPARPAGRRPPASASASSTRVPVPLGRRSPAAVERAWTVVQQHRLGQRPGAEVRAFEAAVRLWRWLPDARILPDTHPWAS